VSPRQQRRRVGGLLDLPVREQQVRDIVARIGRFDVGTQTHDGADRRRSARFTEHQDGNG
jgi:hypothetical protein